MTHIEYSKLLLVIGRVSYYDLQLCAVCLLAGLWLSMSQSSMNGQPRTWMSLRKGMSEWDMGVSAKRCLYIMKGPHEAALKHKYWVCCLDCSLTPRKNLINTFICRGQGSTSGLKF